MYIPITIPSNCTYLNDVNSLITYYFVYEYVFRVCASALGGCNCPVPASGNDCQSSTDISNPSSCQSHRDKNWQPQIWPDNRSCAWCVTLFELPGIFDRLALVRLADKAGYGPLVDTTPVTMVDTLASPQAWRYPHHLKSTKARLRTEALVPQINILAATSRNPR